MGCHGASRNIITSVFLSLVVLPGVFSPKVKDVLACGVQKDEDPTKICVVLFLQFQHSQTGVKLAGWPEKLADEENNNTGRYQLFTATTQQAVENWKKQDECNGTRMDKLYKQHELARQKLQKLLLENNFYGMCMSEDKLNIELTGISYTGEETNLGKISLLYNAYGNADIETEGNSQSNFKERYWEGNLKSSVCSEHVEMVGENVMKCGMDHSRDDRESLENLMNMLMEMEPLSSMPLSRNLEQGSDVEGASLEAKAQKFFAECIKACRFIASCGGGLEFLQSSCRLEEVYSSVCQNNWEYGMLNKVTANSLVLWNKVLCMLMKCGNIMADRFQDSTAIGMQTDHSSFCLTALIQHGGNHKEKSNPPSSTTKQSSQSPHSQSSAGGSMAGQTGTPTQNGSEGSGDEDDNRRPPERRIGGCKNSICPPVRKNYNDSTHGARKQPISYPRDDADGSDRGDDKRHPPAGCFGGSRESACPRGKENDNNHEASSQPTYHPIDGDDHRLETLQDPNTQAIYNQSVEDEQVHVDQTTEEPDEGVEASNHTVGIIERHQNINGICDLQPCSSRELDYLQRKPPETSPLRHTLTPLENEGISQDEAAGSGKPAFPSPGLGVASGEKSQLPHKQNQFFGENDRTSGQQPMHFPISTMLPFNGNQMSSHRNESPLFHENEFETGQQFQSPNPDNSHGSDAETSSSGFEEHAEHLQREEYQTNLRRLPTTPEIRMSKISPHKTRI